MTVLLAAMAALAVLLWSPPPAPTSPDPTRPDPTPQPARAVPGRVQAWVARRRGAGSARLRREQERVQALDGVAAALEAGLPTGRALHLALAQVGGSAAAADDPWAELRRAAASGQPLAPAWHRMARRSGSPTLASVARAWRVAGDTGAPVAEAVRAGAAAARERLRLTRAVEVATAGARATATVLALLPVAGVALAALLGIGPAQLYGTPLALASAGVGVGLLGIGHLMVRRMVTGVLRGVA